MTPELEAIAARDAAVGTGNHIRKQYGPTAAWAILDRRHLLDALRAAEEREARLPAALAHAMWEENVETPHGHMVPKSDTLAGAYLELAQRLLRRLAALAGTEEPRDA